MFAALFGGLGAIVIWLAGEHNENNVRISRLKLWAIISFVLSLYLVIAYAGMLMTFPSILALVGLLPPLLFTISSILVFVFSGKEITSN
jgi:hypothetical protein